MFIDSNSHKQLHDIVAERIRAAILNGYYKPGEWLRQERLAQDLGVSQMPVREAIKALTAEGLIEHVPYRGVRVVVFSIEDIQDLYANRAFLEGHAAFCTAEIISDEELLAMEELLVEIEKQDAPESLARYRELNRNFHQQIYTASKRKYLIRTLDQMWETFPTMLIANFAATATHPLPARSDVDSGEHATILAALKAHDAPAAELAMRRHILTTGEQLVALMKSQV